LFSFIFFFAFILITQSSFYIYDYINQKNFLAEIFEPVKSDLITDEFGNINILLIGHGGGSHDGPNLTDSMIIASINPQQKNVMMLSIPRDFWVENKYSGGSRINEIYRNVKRKLEKNFQFTPESASQEAIRILQEKIGEITSMDIPYHAKINFSGFIDIINTLGGIEIVNDKSIYDEAYPDGNWGIETFSLKKGPHTLDGSTALKFARSRHNSSDFERAGRQQKVIQAIKDKTLSMGILTSPRKMKNLFSVFEKNFESNLSYYELLTIGFIGADIQKDNMFSAVLNDNYPSAGGFLVTPPRPEYGGAFVLIPYSGEKDYSRIHIFSSLFFHYRSLQNMSFEMLNGSSIPGKARQAASRMERYGLPIASIGNNKEDRVVEETELWLYQEIPNQADFITQIEKIFPVKVIDMSGIYEEIDVTGSFIIGKNFK
ncbi:hypothetical protein COB57_06160, partial [Candidatus Peregrinibacteria bacterium]